MGTVDDPARAPIDSDVDLHLPAQRSESAVDLRVLGAIALGGVIGAEARYGAGLLLPHGSAQWPWSTLVGNASGSFLLGVLMVIVVEHTAGHRLLRPFLGVGVLGGYTTFSTAMVEVQQLLAGGRPALALAYLAGSAALALACVWAGTALTRAGGHLVGRRRRS